MGRARMKNDDRPQPSRSVSLPVTGRSGTLANSKPSSSCSPTTRSQSATIWSGPASPARTRVRVGHDLGARALEFDRAKHHVRMMRVQHQVAERATALAADLRITARA